MAEITLRQALETLMAEALAIALRDDVPDWIGARARAVLVECHQLIDILDAQALAPKLRANHRMANEQSILLILFASAAWCLAQ